MSLLSLDGHLKNQLLTEWLRLKYLKSFIQPHSTIDLRTQENPGIIPEWQFQFQTARILKESSTPTHKPPNFQNISPNLNRASENNTMNPQVAPKNTQGNTLSIEAAFIGASKRNPMGFLK